MQKFVLSIGVRGIGAILALAVNILLARLLGVADYGRYMTWLSGGLVLGALAVRGADQLLTRELARGASTQALLQRKLAWWAAQRLGVSLLIAVPLYVAWIATAASDVLPEAGIWFAASAGVSVVGLLAICRLEMGAVNGFSAPLRSQALGLIVRNGATLVLLAVVYAVFSAPRNVAEALWLSVGAFVVAVLVGTYWLHGLSHRAVDNAADKPPTLAAGVESTRSWNVASRHFMLVTIASVLINRVDVVLVSAMSSAEVAGTYVAGARLAQVAQMVALSVSVVLKPQFARAYTKNDKEQMWRLLRMGLYFTMPVAVLEVALVIMLAPLLVDLFGLGFEAAALPLVLVTIGYALWAVAAPGYAFLAMTGSENIVAALSWLVLIVNLSTTVALVPSFGAAGAGVAMTLGYGIATVALFVVLIKRRKETLRAFT